MCVLTLSTSSTSNSSELEHWSIGLSPQAEGTAKASASKTGKHRILLIRKEIRTGDPSPTPLKDPFAIPRNAFFVLPRQQRVLHPEDCEPGQFPWKVPGESGGSSPSISHGASTANKPSKRLPWTDPVWSISCQVCHLHHISTI